MASSNEPAVRRPELEGRSTVPSHVIHDVEGAGPIYAAVQAPGGRHYFSDEYHHRILVQEPTGYLWSIGGPGSGAGDFRHPRGLALLPAPWDEDARLFVCDAWNHRVQVFDGLGHFRFAFGCEGQAQGQFDVPSDVAIVRPEFAGEELDPDDGDGAFVAVADRWNNRVQVFDIHGVFVASIGSRPGETSASRGVAGAFVGWPFFRVGLNPTTPFPIRLEWRDPELVITSANGRDLPVDLAKALLPDFERWRRNASRLDLEFADRTLSRLPLPPRVAAGLRTALGTLLLDEGRLADAGRAWAVGWPADLGPEAAEEELQARVAVVAAAADRRPRRPPTRLMASLATRVSIERRRRARAELSASLDGERRRAPRHRDAAPEVSPTTRVQGRVGPADTLGELAARLAGIRGQDDPCASTVWTAPPGEGDLQQAAVNAAGQIAVIASGAPALWMLDRHGTPLARFALPSGTSPRGIASDGSEGWFVTDVQHGCVLHLDGCGKLVRRWGSKEAVTGTMRLPVAVAVLGGRVFVVERGNQRVEVYSTDGSALGGYPRLHAPAALLPEAERLWVAEWRHPGIRALDPTTGDVRQTLAHPDLVSPSAMARVGAMLVVADCFGRAIHGFDGEGRWLGRVWRTREAVFGRLTGLVGLADGVVAVDHDHGTLVRLGFPDGGHPWHE